MSEIASNVVVSNDVGQALNEFFGKFNFSKTGVLVDENTREHCLPVVKPFLPENCIVIEIKSGEEQKNLETCAYIWKALTEAAFDRKSLLVNLGGGVIGDMGGFCAATFKRGIDFVNIPTTLLAQVDASVGGKLGIDFFGLKNHIGVFREPLRVFISSLFLKTLDKRELRSGFAEVIKHGLIADGEKFFEISSKPLNHQDWNDIIAHSVAVKSKVVAEDPQEKGLRKILNFGHTVGHAIETYYLNKGQKILHGEAIAIGMVCESWLSKEKCGLKAEETDVVFKYIDEVYDLKPIETSAFEEICRLTLQDKKNENDEVKASLLEKIGTCLYNIAISKEEIIKALQSYNNRL